MSYDQKAIEARINELISLLGPLAEDTDFDTILRLSKKSAEHLSKVDSLAGNSLIEVVGEIENVLRVMNSRLSALEDKNWNEDIYE